MLIYDDAGYGSDTTISQDWESMYHPAICQCGNHSEAAALHNAPDGQSNKLVPGTSKNAGLSKVLQWRRRVRSYDPAGLIVGATADYHKVVFDYNNSLSIDIGLPTSSSAIVDGFSRLSEVNSGAGTILRDPTHRDPSHNISAHYLSPSSHITTGNISTGASKSALHNPVTSIDKNIDIDNMPNNIMPIKWVVRYEGSTPPNTPTKKGQYGTGVFAKPSSIVSQVGQGNNIGHKSTLSVEKAENILPATATALQKLAAGVNKVAKTLDLTVVSPKTPPRLRIKLVNMSHSNAIPSTTTSAIASEPMVFEDPFSNKQLLGRKAVSATMLFMRAGRVKSTSTPVSKRASKRKATSNTTTGEVTTMESSIPTHAPKKRKSSIKAVGITDEVPGMATDETTNKGELKARNPSLNKRKASKISISKPSPSMLNNDKLATPIAPPTKRARKSRVAPMSTSSEAITEANNEPSAPVAVSRAARAARRNGEEEEELVEFGKKTRRIYQDWSDPKSSAWDVIRFLESDEMLAKDDLLQLPPKNFTYIDEVNMKLKNPNKYFSSPPKAPRSTPHPKLVEHAKRGTSTDMLRVYYDGVPHDRVLPLAGQINIPKTGSGRKPNPSGQGRNSKPKSPLAASTPAHEVETSVESLSLPSLSSSILESSYTLVSPATYATPAKVSEQSFAAFSATAHAPRAKKIRNRKDPADVFASVFPEFAAMYDVLTKSDLQEETFHTRPSIQFPVPDHIKAILVDDWENVTKNQQLVPLPAAYSVNKILDDYLDFETSKRQTGSATADILDEVVAGLREYFEKTLGRILLYRFERSQYIEVRDGFNKSTGELAGKSVSDTYGAEHLCRLIVTLPELIAQTNMDTQSANRLREELTKFTIWIGRNVSKYFVSEYETPGPEYAEKARSG
ncbi:hypothetical protein WAI453_000374 [Rhynchosporium graminicola]|uniref:Chromatin modification-related protein EAF3 n=1 Tax=Rhynchosporium graminicola TaxID=2792576 RepID=A0A1E1JQ92_9HELO|nr:uncharacterized protein RCO7_00954 [Rhynchosporium commune]